jgi:uncharacterized membrane protein
MSKGKKVGLYLLIIFYLLAGINHFINPTIYIQIIPPYLPNPELLNLLSGIAEIALAIFLIFKSTRTYAVYGIIAMLIAFLPAHIYMIQIGGCAGDLCVPLWVAWLRLIVFHPLLILWAWMYRK